MKIFQNFNPNNLTFSLPSQFHVSSIQIAHVSFNRKVDSPIGRNIHILAIKALFVIPNLHYTYVKSILTIVTIIAGRLSDNKISVLWHASLQ